MVGGMAATGSAATRAPAAHYVTASVAHRGDCDCGGGDWGDNGGGDWGDNGGGDWGDNGDCLVACISIDGLGRP
jgi:hypothetical protein